MCVIGGGWGRRFQIISAYSPHEKDADAGVILGPGHAELFFKVVQLSTDECVSAEKIKKVNEPEVRLERNLDWAR